MKTTMEKQKIVNSVRVNELFRTIDAIKETNKRLFNIHSDKESAVSRKPLIQ